MIFPLLQAAVLGTVQGVTEFLPVSSTAHLILFQKMFGLDATTYGLSFDMFTNLGTLAATVIFFRADLADIFGRLRLPLGRPLSGEEKLPWTILLATIPVGLVGKLLQKDIETSFRTLPVIAGSLAAVGLLMIWVEKRGQHAQASEPRMAQVWGISLAQCLAFVPGVSRSGITISAAMLLGLDRVKAARTSFLLSLPITALATLSQIAEFGSQVLEKGISPDVAAFYAVGGLASLAVGYATIKFLLDFYRKYSLSSFGAYRLALAALIVGSILYRGS